MVDFITDEAYDKCLKALEDANEKWKTGISSGVVLLPSGDKAPVGITHACHAWVNQAFRIYGGRDGVAATKFDAKAQNFIVASCFKPEKRSCSVEAAEAFVDWLCTESPFKQYIINRDDRDSVKSFGPLIWCGPGEGASYSECIWICKSLRYGVESGHALDAWYSAYKGGVHPIVALAASQHFQRKTNTLRGAVFSFNEAINSHNAVFQYFDKEHVPAVFESKPFKFASSSYNLFDKEGKLKKYNPDTYRYDSDILKYLSNSEELTIDDGWGGKLRVEGLTEDKLVASLLKFQQEALKGEEPYSPPPVTRNTIYLEGDL